MRLDVYLFENGLVKSRTYAQDAIKEGRVSVNGKIITKPSYDVNDEIIEIESKSIEFVSRGGLKLYEALNDFKLNLKDCVVADIGASTGGFSDVALQQGASYVYAIDVGNLQLDETLKNHPKLKSMENTNALDLNENDFDHKVDTIVMDVSFVSIKTILPHLIKLFKNANFIVLIKPQFEVGKKFIGKNGIVKDKKSHLNLLEDIYYFLHTQKCNVIDMTISKTKGKDGNQEYFVYFTQNEVSKTMSLDKIKKIVK